MAGESYDAHSIDMFGFVDWLGRKSSSRNWIAPREEPEEAAPSPRRQAILARLREELYADERSLLYRRHVLGLALDQIAAEDGVDRSTIKRRLDRVYEALRKELENLEEDEDGMAGASAPTPTPKPANGPRLLASAVMSRREELRIRP